MPTVLIAGANRGLGREFVRQYAAEGWRIIAGCRQTEQMQPTGEFKGAGRLEVLPLDTGSDRSVRDLRAAVGEDPVDLLICAAGYIGGGRQTIGDLDFHDLAHTLNINCSGPLRLAEAFAPNLSAAKNAKLIALTSRMGSIAQTSSTETMLYRISKTALNEAWKCVSVELRPKGVTAMVLHPGWVSTDMGGPSAPVTPEQSVKGMRRIIAELTQEDAGTFRAFDGSSISW